MKTQIVTSNDKRFLTRSRVLKICYCCNKPIKRNAIDSHYIAIDKFKNILGPILLENDFIDLRQVSNEEFNEVKMMGGSCMKRWYLNK